MPYYNWNYQDPQQKRLQSSSLFTKNKNYMMAPGELDGYGGDEVQGGQVLNKEAPIQHDFKTAAPIVTGVDNKYGGETLPDKMTPWKSQVPAQMKQQNNNNTIGRIGQGVGAVGQGVKGIIQAQSKDYSATNTAIQSGLSGLGALGQNNAKMSTSGVTDASGFSQAGAGGMAAGTAVAGIGGELLSNSGKEEAGGILSGAAAGASAGMILGPWGAAAGAVVGGAMGAIGGKKKRKARLKRQRAEAHQKAVKAENATVQRKDADIANQARFFDEHGNRIGVARNGLKITAKTSFRVKLSKESSLIPLQKEKEVVKFKRGGKTAMQKENIIPDGVTHGQLNKTNIKKDKGLAVVLDGKKEYEIEKEELVLNLKATSIAEELSKRYGKDSDKKHLVALGKLMKKELLNNTYDYTKKFGINRGKALKDTDINEGIETRPEEGKYKIKETDVKAEGGKMQILSNGGVVMANMEGGARIFSRTHTKRLIELAKSGTNKDGLADLGKYMDKIINIQDTQEKQYVET